MRRIVFATRNRHKIKEFQELIAPVGFEATRLTDLAPGAPDVDETGSTFLENAVLKADAAYALTGLPSMADDSGICVDHLNGAPGIFSARWAGGSGSDRDEANNDRLLSELAGTENRGAHYYCALALVCSPDFLTQPYPSQATLREDGTLLLSTAGTVNGTITRTRSGSGGFGYDPLFFVDEVGCTFAEIPAEQKHALSHRGKAFRELVSLLEKHAG